MLLYFVSDQTLGQVFFSRYSLMVELAVGVAYGLIAAFLAWHIVSLPGMTSTRVFFANIFRKPGLSIFDIAFISLCAGIGEEILFRGFIQPYLGIWLTSIIFVAIHGYLNPFNRQLFLYGIVMIVLIGGIGLLANRVGLTSAITAHAVVDIYLLYKLISKPLKTDL